jgi:parallel beta-helix repeat protein
LTKLESKKNLIAILIATLFLISSGCTLLTTKTPSRVPLKAVHLSSETYVKHDPIEIDGDEALLAQAHDEGWPGSGTPSDPIIISGYVFNVTYVQPVRLWNIELSWEFRNNYLTTRGVICGIWIEGGVGGVIADNILVECHGGIIVDGQDFLIVNNSISYNTGYGIEVYGTASNIEIRNNTIRGVGLDGMNLPAMTDSLIVDNTILDCTTDGIDLSQSSERNEIRKNDIRNNSYGINCKGSNNVIKNNAIGFNKKGISIASTSEGTSGSHNNITYNSILNNTDYGLSIRESGTSNAILYNDFINNGDEFQVRDNGVDNTFLNNYYNEWITPDDDSDGFVDEPYSIEGDAESTDEYPRAELNNPLPDWYTYIPIIPTTTTSSGPTSSEPPPPLPMMEIALALGGVLVVAVVIIVFIRKRG